MADTRYKNYGGVDICGRRNLAISRDGVAGRAPMTLGMSSILFIYIRKLQTWTR